MRRDVLNSGVHMTCQHMCAHGVGSSCKQVETHAGCWRGGGGGDLVHSLNAMRGAVPYFTENLEQPESSGKQGRAVPVRYRYLPMVPYQCIDECIIFKENSLYVVASTSVPDS